MDLLALIRSRREVLGLTLRQTAKAVGVDPAYLSRVESGQTPPSDELLAGLARVLDTDPDELLLLAGRVPSALRKLVEREPERVAYAIRGLATMIVAEPTEAYSAITSAGPTAIEDGFPFEEVSDVAEIESWRKEVYRPVYHMHKWWAQRLGSVFRAAILGATSPEGSAIMRMFYRPVKLPAPVVFDPFMGSGTTAGEAHKLGCTVIGRDINPVAWRSARTALSHLSRTRLVALFEQLEAAVAAPIRALYDAEDEAARPCEVLYYFWVKVLPCPNCSKSVDLFSSYVFAQHAYVKKYPEVRVCCPGCGGVFASHHEAEDVSCPACSRRFNQHSGPAKHTSATCSACAHQFPIAKTARAAGRPPDHRLYAKLVLTGEGEKRYLPATEKDRASFKAAASRLRELSPVLPETRITEGHNTKQVLNYGYSAWREMHNDRQLLAISLLASGIRALPDCPERDALFMLLSGVLEFNNMFASYKGEGTGAVRHMFAHHVLKPERTPIEANVWGTPRSSGSFSTLFRSRLLRGMDYKEAPFEIRVGHNGTKPEGEKVFGLSPPMGAPILDRYPAGGLPPGAVYLSCGDSARTDIPDGTVDLVLTDPPFFDNVHYSELADFFYAWHRLFFRAGVEADSTRQPEEVQDTEVERFAKKLGDVFGECHRVLREDGLLVFSYHHSREDGWTSVAQAVLGAGFSFVQAQPVKAEMSVAMPKSQTKEPIDLDIMLVCKKRRCDTRPLRARDEAASLAFDEAAAKVGRFNKRGRKLSRGDTRIVLASQLLVELSAGRSAAEALAVFRDAAAYLADSIERLHGAQLEGARPRRSDDGVQVSLL